MKVSVIVPVYNTEKYLHKCLDSLVNQTIKGIEIIIVNDGSSDHSQAIINKYCANYSFVHGYKKENGGLGSARNFGLQVAKGEYIGFVDSDDYVNPDMYEKMYNAAIECKADLVICDFNFTEENGHISGTTFIKKEFNKENLSERQYCLKYGRSEAVNKLYSRSLFINTNIRYPKILYEDYSTTPLLIEAANKISYVPEPLYCYVQRKNSIMDQTNSFSEKNFDILKATEIIVASKHLFRNRADFNFYLDEVAPVHAFIRYYRNIFFISNRKLREKTIIRWGSELNRLLPGWHRSKAIRELRSTISNPVKKILFDIIIFTFHSQKILLSYILLMLNKYFRFYKYGNL